MIRIKYFSVIPALLLALACAPGEMNLEAARSKTAKVTVTPDKVAVVEGNTARLTAQVSPWNAEDKNVVWKSSDEAVAIVDESGKVTAIVPGEAEITASVGDISGKCIVTVKSSHVPATGVIIKDMTCLSVKIGEIKTVTAELTPQDATERPVWTSSDTDIFTVDPETGALSAVAAGTAVLTASVSGGSASIPVLVHGNLWIERTDPLVKPISSEEYAFITDTIRVARGETATFQGIVRADNSQGKITMEVTEFAPEGQGGIAVNPELYWVRDIKCSRRWDAWAGGAPADELWADGDMYPDPLMPAGKWDVSLQAGGKAAMWAEFTVPHTATPGLYKGTIKVRGTEEAECVFYVQVYDVDLPDRQGLNVINWVNTDLSAMNDGNGTDMYLNYELLENSVIPLMNKFGQNCYRLMYATRSNTTCTARANGQTGKYEPVFDFSLYKREIELFARSCPGIRMIHGSNIISARNEDSAVLCGFELDNDGFPVTENGNFKIVYRDITDRIPPEVEAYLGPYFRQLQDFLASNYLSDGRSWLDVFAQTILDEPNDKLAATWNTIAGFVKTAAPGIKILEPIETDKLDPELLDYPCPTLGKIAENRATGNQEQWMYTCMQPQGNYANRFIRIPLIKTRIIHWVNYRYNATGFLHWGLNYWAGAGNKPYYDASGEYPGGDMYIIYPGYREVYPSIRLCAMRDGIRDYDLLKTVEARDEGKAAEFCSRLVQDNATYDTDVKAFRQLRKDMLEFLAPTPSL